MPFFSKVFKGKDSSAAPKGKKTLDQGQDASLAPPKPKWEDAWIRSEVAPAEIQELVHYCTQEMKTRVLDTPFLLLPFRPEVDQSAARSFVRSYFRSQYEGSGAYTGLGLQQELRLAEPMVLCSIMKWCWSRIPGGVVTWDSYELFRVGEQDSRMARHAFDTFIPLSVDSDARKQIIFDFFDLLAAIAAHSKNNGLGGRKLSRMAGWWAFELSDNGKGFDGGYKSWSSAADATCHLFFAYLRSRSPESLSGISGIAALPRSLQSLLLQTEYPPERPVLMQTTTTKVVMIVDSVSPTPFALLRRAKHFEYRDDDRLLQAFSSFEDPVSALTDENQRVLRCISSANQSASHAVPKTSMTTREKRLRDPTWSSFEDFGFSNLVEDSSANGNATLEQPTGMFQSARSRPGNFGRPTTPSWADFLSTGFADPQARPSQPALLLPPDKQLPPLSDVRIHSSQSHIRNGGSDDLEPGELASINTFDLDDAFWWVWMISLASEETSERKAVFGRCALIETMIDGGRWLLMEEQVKGAGPGPEEGAYIVEKKSRNPFSRRNRLARRKSTGKKTPTQTPEPYARNTAGTPTSKVTIGPDQHAKVHAAAARLAQEHRDREHEEIAQRRARLDDNASVKTSSVLTLQPLVASEAGPAMKWAKAFDNKDAIRAAYLGDKNAGTGRSVENLIATANGTALSPGVDKSPGSLTPTPRDDRLPSPRVPRKDVPSPSPLPSPAPLPAAPKSKARNAEASEAAEVPLPQFDEKPLPPSDQSETHPALRKQLPERSETPEPPVKPASPEPTKKSPPNKLKKEKGSSGLKKLFGKKKTEPPAKKKMEPAPAGDARRIVPQGTVARRLSLLKKQNSSDANASKTNMDSSASVSKPTARDETSADLSRVHTNEQNEADQEFSRFDQGPLEDNPAFVPEDASEPSMRAGSPSAGFQTRAAERLYNPHEEPVDKDQPSPVSPVEPSQASGDNESEASIDLKKQTTGTDRWAQIRRNAADRAQRVSEEQSRPSQSQSQRTDDGETSGEETIESRVARIKARVAELTGNMDSDGKIQTESR